mmetsp:Transcript_23662/g.34427  ORF Transcript_23662/g.34427 Transcript_23662/m.34427 type:complete len:108 (-) Transcript_23662:192-515(-)
MMRQDSISFFTQAAKSRVSTSRFNSVTAELNLNVTIECNIALSELPKTQIAYERILQNWNGPPKKTHQDSSMEGGCVCGRVFVGGEKGWGGKVGGEERRSGAFNAPS